MTYVPRDNTWKKMFKGNIYFVSCLALGCEQTKEASWKAANAWWYAKKAEIKPEAMKPCGSRERTMDMVNEFAGRNLQPDEVPAVYNNMIEVALSAEPQVQSVFFYELLGKERYQVLLDAQELGKKSDALVQSALEGEPVMMDTVTAHVKNWVDLLEIKVANKSLSISSFDNYRREICHFENYLGKFSPITIINERAVEGYFLEISKNKQKNAGKKLRFDVARIFIRKLYESGKINLPRNLSSRDLVFSPDHGNKTVWTLEQFKSAYGASSGLRRLCLLLSCNCCFHASDMSDLEGKIDYENGTITKGRKKTENQKSEKTTWVLWPETLELLKLHSHELSSLTSKKLVNGKFKRRIAPEAKGLKQVRTTTH